MRLFPHPRQQERFKKDKIFKKEIEYRFMISTEDYSVSEIDINFDIVEKINLYVTDFFNMNML